MSAGGTGGGVYPALTVAKSLQDVGGIELHFVSSAIGMENDLVARSGVRFDVWSRVQAGPLHGVNIIRKITSILRLGIGTLQAFWLLLRRRPAAIFLTGGWVGLPVALAAWFYRIPVVIFVPDIEPGRTLKVLGRFARVITATVDDTAQYYPKNKRVVATGYPLRPDLLEADRAAGVACFGLDADKRTLLVFGGSSGSRAINRQIYRYIAELLAIPDLQILHISGKLDAEEVAMAHQQLAPSLQTRYHVCDYVDDMGLALAAADLVVSRAGAGTLGEFPLFELPAILIPLAYAWRYQEINADWLASRGAAIRLDETDMTDELIPLIHGLLNDEGRLQAMRTAAQQLVKTDGADNIARVILDLSKR